VIEPSGDLTFIPKLLPLTLNTSGSLLKMEDQQILLVILISDIRDRRLPPPCLLVPPLRVSRPSRHHPTVFPPIRQSLPFPRIKSDVSFSLV